MNKPAHRPDKKSQPLNLGAALTLLYSVAAYFSSQVIAAILLFAIALVTTGRTAESLSSDTKIFFTTSYLFLTGLLVSGVTIGLIYGFLRWRQVSFKDIGFNRLRLKYIGQALSGYGAYILVFFLLTILVNSASPELLEQQQELGFSRDAAGATLIPIFISLVILPPLMEETLMRGFLFTGLRSRLNFWLATVIVSVLFAAAHLGGGGEGVLLWIAAIDTFVLSIVLCYLKEKTGSLWPPLFLHGFKNFIAFTVLFLINY